MEADMITTNRAQMAAAIKAVPHDQHTVIEAISRAGEVLVRYTFPGLGNSRHSISPCGYHEKHIKRLARQVMKTPAAAWR